MTHSVSTDRLDIELFKGNGVCVCVCVSVFASVFCVRARVFTSEKTRERAARKRKTEGWGEGTTREYSKGEHSREYKA